MQTEPMPRTSPGGHPIGLIDGDPGTIARRANEIQTRGTQMRHAATRCSGSWTAGSRARGRPSRR